MPLEDGCTSPVECDKSEILTRLPGFNWTAIAPRPHSRKPTSRDLAPIAKARMRRKKRIADLCRDEGIHPTIYPTIYYKWLKDFRGKNTVPNFLPRPVNIVANTWSGLKQRKHAEGPQD
jgi:hypothetical protein